MGSLSRGDPSTAGLASALEPAALLLPLPQGFEFQISAPGQQMATVCITELSARTRAWC